MGGGTRLKHLGTPSDSDVDFDHNDSPVARQGREGKRGKGGDPSQATSPGVGLGRGKGKGKFISPRDPTPSEEEESEEEDNEDEQENEEDEEGAEEDDEEGIESEDEILGCDETDRAKPKATVFDPQEDSEWKFMYDAHYVDPKHGVEFGSYHGMKPYFRVLNNMLRVTLTPKVGDHTHILSSTKTLMFAMREGAEPFSVFDFIWTEILYYNSYTSKASLIYASYLMKMILRVVGCQFICDHKHSSITSKKFSLIASPPHGSTPPAATDVPQSSATAAARGEAVGPSATPRPLHRSSKLTRAVKSMFCICQDSAVAIREQQQALTRVQSDLRTLAATSSVELPPPVQFTPLPDMSSYDNPWGIYTQATQAGFRHRRRWAPSPIAGSASPPTTASRSPLSHSCPLPLPPSAPSSFPFLPSIPAPPAPPPSTNPSATATATAASTSYAAPGPSSTSSTTDSSLPHRRRLPPPPPHRRPVHGPQRVLRAFRLGPARPQSAPSWFSPPTPPPRSLGLEQYVELVNSVAQPPPPIPGATPDVVREADRAPLEVVAVEEDGEDRKDQDQEEEEVVRGSVTARRVPLYKELYEASSRKRDARLKTLEFEVRFAEESRLSLERLAEVLPRITPKKEEVPEPFIPLTDEDEDIVCHALRGRNRYEKLAVHEASNIVITREILQCLNDKEWLNDEVINLYLDLLKEREQREPSKFLKCHFFNTFFYKKVFHSIPCKKMDHKKKVRIFVPIHKEVHWCLAVINIRDKKFQYLDSLGSMDMKVLTNLARYLVDEVKDKTGQQIDALSWKQEGVQNLPLQENGWDCGMFMLKYIDFFSRNMDLIFGQKHMRYFRRRTAKEILNLRAE
ncbi:hypothetical protein PR202_gb20372 [Eleusine coracana subsp. coracana]|uniref:Ubiquitin-like protease family profile domain-containing protein n=1 Tax=Eleusine coracana subsp. coracana TaxID=191504 RepID=A0AAV5FAI6_ELECO|nr:hypothetical protein PR202_gb20372 [Eleusine coracana subsp. coracana]